MHRMLALIRTGQDFGPPPPNPQDSIVPSKFIEFETPFHFVELEWIETADATHSQGNALYVSIGGGTPYVMLEGVIQQLDEEDLQVLPFTLEWELGRKLHRVTIDITVVPDDNMSVAIDGDSQQVLRLVASAMPRITAFAN
ncbi:MAG: hypothetical protein E2O40_00605 [Planctomycetota bacterium]|nr:MAG: hypothetical protein E2O40_00605 [Planctomycetota bacterium]